MLVVSQRVSQQAQIQRIAYNIARYELELVDVGIVYELCVGAEQLQRGQRDQLRDPVEPERHDPARG